MSPPLYNDLGRSAKDIFNSGYNFDTFKLDLKTKTPAGVEFSSGGVSHIDSGKVLGTLETRYKFKEYGKCVARSVRRIASLPDFNPRNLCVGLSFSEKWNTSNILATEVSLQDLFKGAKFSAESTFAPQTGYVCV